MRIARRFVTDESGMTMALAVIMIVLIGVMGAGLLTFVSKDLNTVTEENRGQSAFELADAGVAAAKRQLKSDCITNSGCQTNYNDTSSTVFVGTEDNRWSAAKGGLTLNDLNGDGDASDNVNVKIAATATYSFTVTSEGHYGDSKRKIEARLKGVSAGGSSGILGHPLYITPSSIKVFSTTKLRDISLFSGQDILIQDDTSRQAFIDDMADQTKGTITGTGANDSLDDWNSLQFAASSGQGPWNTVGRMQNDVVYSKHKADKPLLDPGLAAVGRICGFSSTIDINAGVCAASSTPGSVADGVYGYDCTTGNLQPATCPETKSPRGNQLTFVDKQPQNQNPNTTGTITFPFPHPVPKPARLKAKAQATYTCPASTTCAPPFNDIFRSISGQNKTVFVDANNSTVNWQTSGNPNLQGVLVVWCGHLVQQEKFQGIILNLYGDGTAFNSTNCSGALGNPTKGTYTNLGQDFSGWLYAAGGTTSIAGIELGPGSILGKNPAADWSFLDDAFEGAPPSDFVIDGWRELYQ